MTIPKKNEKTEKLQKPKIQKNWVHTLKVSFENCQLIGVYPS